jgi:hypothetical protein
VQLAGVKPFLEFGGGEVRGDVVSGDDGDFGATIRHQAGSFWHGERSSASMLRKALGDTVEYRRFIVI